jgi:hypothetical protein
MRYTTTKKTEATYRRVSRKRIGVDPARGNFVVRLATLRRSVGDRDASQKRR